jgi:hypothetical protein
MDRTETKASLGQRASSEFQGGGVLPFAERMDERRAAALQVARDWPKPGA